MKFSNGRRSCSAILKWRIGASPPIFQKAPLYGEINGPYILNPWKQEHEEGSELSRQGEE
jgi:hypothetical protein